MAFGRFQDFLGGLVKRQRRMLPAETRQASIDELTEKLMGTVGEVSAIVTARQVLDSYAGLPDEGKLAFFHNIEQGFNANPALVKLAFKDYETTPSSANLNKLSKAAEPLRHELLRRLNSTPGATHDLVAMRTDLLRFLEENPELKSVDEDFVRLFSSWFGRGFLVLQTINWSTSAEILERIIRYEAVHEIMDWNDLRSRIDPPNRRCFAFFHPALVGEPLIFVQVALGNRIPASIDSILEETDTDGGTEYSTATFYSISNCQPGLKNISFGNFLIKQVVQELRHEFPSIDTFVTLSPIPGFRKWLKSPASDELAELKDKLNRVLDNPESMEKHGEHIRKAAFNYLMQSKQGKYPADSVARFHLGNGASVHEVHAMADLTGKGIRQSLGAMVNYLYDIESIESNHERYAVEGDLEYNDTLKGLLVKS